MPTYEYDCGICGTFEQFQRITEDPLSDCPRCGNAVRRLISSGTGVIFKGSGFYSTDSRASGKSDDGNGKEASRADGDSAAKDSAGKDRAGKDSAAGESKTDSKSDTSTKTKKKEPAAATAARD